MARKIVNNNDPGTSTVFGGDDLDQVNKYLTGTDQSATDPVTIATTTTFKNSKLVLRNPADTYSYTVVPAAIAAARNLTLPLLTGDDTVTTNAATQTLTNKTVDSLVNTIKNLGSYYYYVYYDGANYVARNMKTGAIDSTNTDAYTVIQYALTNSVTGKGKVFLDAILFQLSNSLQPPSGSWLEGAGSQLTQLRPTGNFPAIIIPVNAATLYIGNIFITHNQSGYTNSLVQFREGTHAVRLHNIEFYDFDWHVGSCIEFYNNAAASAAAGLYDHFITDCGAVGFAQVFLVTIPNSTNWVNAIHISGGWFDGSKYFIKSNAAGATTNVDGWQIINTDWQYEATNATPANEAAIMFDDTATHNYTRIDGSIMWDTPSNVNLVNTNSSSDYYLSGVIPDTKIAGSGFSTLDGNGNIRKNWSRTATETMANKTIDAATNTKPNTVVSPVVMHTGWYIPAAGTTLTTIGSTGGMLSQHTATGAGSNTNTFDTTEGVLANFVSGASAGNAAGLVSPTAGVGVGRRLFGMKAVCRAKVDSTTTSKFLFGFTSNSTLPLAAATQPLGATEHGCIVGFVETGTGSTNWTIWHNDGATSVTADNITGPIAKDASFHTIDITWAAAGNIIVTFDGTPQTVSADLPATTANLFFNLVAVNTASAARTLSVHGAWIQADK